MNKTDVQKRVLMDGEPISLDDFTWDEKTKTFSSDKPCLVIDFSDVDGCTFRAGWHCTFETGWHCTFETGSDCTFNTKPYCNFETGARCTFNTGSTCNFNTDSDCTFNTGSGCYFKARWHCNFKTGEDCTFNTAIGCTFETGERCNFNTSWKCNFKTGEDCTFNTGPHCNFETGERCNFRTGWSCNFKTGERCNFKTGWNCNFKTRSYCTFETGPCCTFETGDQSVIIRMLDHPYIVQPKEGEIIQLFPDGQRGHLTNGMYNGKPHIIADGIVSEIISQKGNVYKVKNLGETTTSWLVKDGDTYAHGKTLKEAREDLAFKQADVDKSEYEGLTMDAVKTPMEWAICYRAITGACREGIKQFMKQQNLKDSYALQEIIQLTESAYGGQMFKQFFKKGDE